MWHPPGNYFFLTLTILYLRNMMSQRISTVEGGSVTGPKSTSNLRDQKNKCFVFTARFAQGAKNAERRVFAGIVKALFWQTRNSAGRKTTHTRRVGVWTETDLSASVHRCTPSADHFSAFSAALTTPSKNGGVGGEISLCSFFPKESLLFKNLSS
jgi:hypothetical protein